MKLTTIQKKIRLAAIWNFGFMALCLPFSTALTLIFATFGILFGSAGLTWEATKGVFRNPITILCVGLFFWLAASMLWTVAPRAEMIEGILKYRKLMFAPLVAILLLAAGARPRFLMPFFVAGCIIVTLGSLTTWTGMTEYLIGPQDHPGAGWSLAGIDGKNLFHIGPPEKPTFGRSHIAQGAFLAISSLYLTSYVLRPKRLNVCTKNYIWISVIILLQLLTLLNIGGMTGYVLISVGVVLWLLSAVWHGDKKKLLLFATAVAAFISAAYLFSDSANQRIHKSFVDMKSYAEAGALTSEGQRMTFWLSGLKNSTNHPFLGHGVGSFAEVFSQDTEMPEGLRKSRAHPHSEYILMLIQGGIVALTLFALIFLKSFIIYRRNLASEHARFENSQESWWAGTIALLMIVYYIDAIFNSALWDLAEGHLFIILTATLLTSIYELDKSRKN